MIYLYSRLQFITFFFLIRENIIEAFIFLITYRLENGKIIQKWNLKNKRIKRKTILNNHRSNSKIVICIKEVVLKQVFHHLTY